jgi:hypothetical protein
MLGKLVDRIAAMQQHAFITIDKGDLGFADAVEVKPGS